MSNENKNSTGTKRVNPLIPSEKAKNFKGTIKKLFRYMGEYHFSIALVIIFAIGGTVFNIIGPKFLGNATTILSSGLIAKISGTGSIDFTSIGKILLFVLCLYIISALLMLFQSFIMTGITQKICYRMRKEIIEKINRMPMSYFEKRTYGEVLSRITNDIDSLGTGLNQSITQLITSVSTIIGVLFMMLTISPLMTLITLVLLPVSAGLISIVIRFSQKYFRAQQELLAKVNGQVEEIYSGHTIVQAFGQQENVCKTFCNINEKLFESSWKSQFFSGLMFPIMIFIGNLGYVSIAICGSLFASRGIISIGDIQAFIQYTRNFTQPIQQIAQITNMLQSMTAAAERVFQFMDENEEEQESEKDYKPQKINGDVIFENVRFGYNKDQVILKNFCANIKAGQKIAIVGPTGAGKSTIIKLLLRYYDINSGNILLDGKNIKEYGRRNLRNFFSIVLQDTWLFEGTIMENLRYGKIDATDEQVINAAKAAHVHHFIQTLSNGYNTVLNEEASNVSQGQKQLLTIARAILSNRPVLILDEATSSVDTKTELQIQEAMDNLIKGKTSFIIAHRLSTIKNADLILCMKDGDIIEQGNHEQLIEKNGFYANLYNSQFEKA